ncbi:MAG TPA: hypothetical protein VNW46_18095, partial [Gemmatimonadaceae bacterium]|nr:hypothetical protein [Gemmatimonadaceae bacterium]
DAQAGKVKNVDVPISAWTADWHDLAHNHEVRWPYVFVSAYEDGLQVINLSDPKHPKTVGAFYTCDCTHEDGFGGNPDNNWKTAFPSVEQGAFGVDVRNRDGLVVISDMRSGLWLFKVDGFTGYKEGVNSVQDYTKAPGSTPPTS